MFGLCIAGMVSAQVYITDDQFNPNGVTNEGVVVGSFGENMPFVLWDAKSGTGAESMKAIGGQSAGQEGAGGRARFSHDGKFVAAPTWIEGIPVSTNWEKKELPDFAFTYKDIAYVSDFVLLTVGAAEDGTSGIFLKSVNNGTTWTKMESINEGNGPITSPTTGIVSIAPQNWTHILAGGMNGKLYLSTSGGTGWELVDVQPEGDESVVDTYWAMNFMYSAPSAPVSDYGVIGVELEGGTGAVWYTENQGESFAVATGVNGVPSYITYLGDTFFMTTFNGLIQKSVDHGKTWTDVFTTDGAPLYRLKFADDKKGIATSDNVVYITRDGGETWTKKDVLPAELNPLADGAVKWNDATWTGNIIMLAGSGATFYTSTDDGETFRSETVDSEYDGDYTVVYYDRDAYSLLGQQGCFYHKDEVGTVDAFGAGIYDIENDTWTALPSYGLVSDNNVASPWHFSGDGKVVVGDIHVYSPTVGHNVTHAAVMTRSGITDLGSRFDNETEEPLAGRPTQAKGVSYDGSVVVGYQDTWGPRYGCIWTRNEDGSYTQRMMKKDMSVSDDEIDYTDQDYTMANLVYTARSVSPEGDWIGGDGNTWAVFQSPWLWNEEEGYVFPFGENAQVGGSVAAITANGEKAVGWQGTGQSAWLYTKADGKVVTLQEYAEKELGYQFDDFAIASVFDMSPNGRYVVGYGLTGSMEMRGYMIDLLGGGGASIGDKVVEQAKAAVYPNPVADELHVDLPYGSDEVETALTLVDLQGRVVRRIDTANQSNVMNVSNLTEGIYVLDVNARGARKSFKVMVKH